MNAKNKAGSEVWVKYEPSYEIRDGKKDLEGRNGGRMNIKKDFLFVDPKTSNFTIECRILIIKFKTQRY